MAFAYDNRNLPRLTTYAQALDFWAHAKTWLGQTGEHDPRKLDRDKRHTTIRKDRSNNICCKLHRTDVVTYHPDNSLTLKPWASVSTDAFANGLLGYSSGLMTSFNSGCIVVQDRYYRAIDTFKLQRVEGQYVLMSEPVPWVRKTVNRKVANGILKQYDYKAFAAWVDMLATQGLKWARYKPHYHDIPAMLLDREKWPQLLVNYKPHYWSTDAEYIAPAATKNTVRAALYKAHSEVYDTETKPYLESWKEVNNWKANQYR